MSASPAVTPIRGRAAWLNSLLVDHAILRVGWRNWAAVEPGRLYRSSHPLPWQLRQAARRHGLHSVVNLRGARPACGSDVLGRAEAVALGLRHYDAPFESRGAPHRDRVLRLAGLFREMPEPILLHCKSGADRTGLAAGLWLLLQGRPVEDALAQLSLRFGHVKQSKTGVLDAFFALYGRAREKSGVAFLDWVRDAYDEDALRRDVQSRSWADALMDRVLRRE